MKILLISANIYSYKISQHTARLRQNMIWRYDRATPN
jgi:hypothetical protein